MCIQTKILRENDIGTSDLLLSEYSHVAIMQHCYMLFSRVSLVFICVPT